MKLHLPKALAAAVMALFAVPNALADVTFNSTTAVELGKSYNLLQGAGTVVLTLDMDAITDTHPTNFPSLTAGTKLVTATVGTNIMAVASAGSSCFQTMLGDTKRSTGTVGTDGGVVTVEFGSSGTKVYEGRGISGTTLVTDADLKYSDKIYTYAVSSTSGVIKSASFADTTVITNLAGSGDLSVGTAYLAIDGGDSGTGNNGIDLNVSGKGLSIAGSVTLGAIKANTSASKGISVASGSSLTASSLVYGWGAGAIIIDGSATLSEQLRFAINQISTIRGSGEMSAGSLVLDNGGKLESYLTTFNVTGETTVAQNSSLKVGAGSATFTGATTINGSMSISGSGSALFGDLNLSGSFVNTGSLSIKDNATVTFNNGYLKYCSDGELATGNGFGVFNSVALKDVLGENVTIGKGVTWKQGTRTITLGAGNVFNLEETVTSSTYYINSVKESYDYSNATKIVINATDGDVVLTSATSADITVNSGAVLDISGKECEGCDLVLAGGTLKNSGSATNPNHPQISSLTLTANSEVNVGGGQYGGQYGIIIQGYVSTFIDLGEYTLTKTGSGNFYAATLNLRGGGTLKIEDGTFTIGLSEGGEKGSIGSISDTKDTNVWFTGNGCLNSGKGIDLNRNVEFLAMAEDDSTAGVTGTISAALNIGKNTATFKANSQNDKLIISGMISGSGRITVDGAGEVQYKNESTTGASQDLSNSVVEIKTSAKLNLLANYKCHTYLGGLTGDGTLQTSCASESSQTDGYRATVISGDASRFTGVWELTTVGETSANRRVYGVLNTNDGKFGGVVKFTGTNVVKFTGPSNAVTVNGSQLLLAKDTTIAGLQSDAGLTNAVVKGITYPTTNVDNALRDTAGTSFTATARNLTISGNKNLSFSGKLDSLVSLIVGDGTNAASQTFNGATIGGSMELKKQATVTATGNTTIATLKGTGTLTASSGAYSEVKDASSFTGTLTATDDATLQVGKVDSLAAVHSSSSSGVALSGSLSTITVDEMVLAGTWVSVRYSKSEETLPVEATVRTGSLTVSGASTSTLYANLELKADSTLKLDLALAMGSTLTLNRGITLSGSLLDSWTDKSNALTLFSGVDGLTVNGNAVSDGVDNGVTASEVFGDSWSNYKLVMTGGTNNANYNVQLMQVSSDTPEPTTATLSLLALMGLAARRRRKAAK